MQGTEKAMLWGRHTCPFCIAAEKLLKSTGIAYTFVDVESNEELLARLSDLTGDPPSKLTVPKILINGTLIRTSEELQDLAATSALAHLAKNTLQTIPRQPLDTPSERPKRSVCILHTGPTDTVWLAELKKRLDARSAVVCFVDAERLGTFDLEAKPAFSVVINRVSDAVPPSSARFVSSFLSFCEAQGVPVVNGAAAYGVATSKISQQEFSAQCMASAQKRRKTDGSAAVTALKEVPANVKEGCVRAMKAAHADVGSIEYLLHSKTGEPLYFDLNLLSTYPDEALVGRDCWAELADFILSKIKA